MPTTAVMFWPSWDSSPGTLATGLEADSIDWVIVGLLCGSEYHYRE